ncbi:MAG TPA: penicillin acylase family protein [Pyrinomonadaceae bacterium]|nr:penicillin acylase family protein [Pyrinomonadaceae bacterium]
MNRHAASLLRLLLLAFLLSSVAPQTLNAQTPAPASTSIQIAGLRARVTIRRDDRGIPYVSADNDEDLYFGQGYATAMDRLWQMDLLRRNARGELAEILGTSALEEDKRHRTFGFAHVAEAEVAQASPQARAILEAYAKGVNAYIESLEQKKLPPEFQLLQYQPRPWTPADSLVVVKLFFESLSTTWRLDVMREAFAQLPPAKLAALLPETSVLDVLVVGKDSTRKTTQANHGSLQPLKVSVAVFEALVNDEANQVRSLSRVGLHAEALAASNNWVVSGKRTASGKPLLANDPHLAPSAPSIWHLVHLTGPGVRVAGVTAAGLPGVVIGHNDHVAWGFTNVGPDVQDLYIEKFDPANPLRYQTPKGWRDAEVRHEQIKVRKGFTDTATDVVNHDVTVTRHGPIVLEKDSKRYALSWTALNPKLTDPRQGYLLNRARNWREFITALRSHTSPTQNVVYADVEGHIGYYAAGIVPVRKSGDGSVPYDGATDDGEWVSFLPFENLPHLYDPPSGMIVTANQRIIGTDYPHFLTHSWAQPYRARRIYDLLQKTPKLTADDFRRVLGDTYSIAGSTFAQAIVKSLKGHAATQQDAKLQQTLVAIEKWDGHVNADSAVAPIVAQMRLAVRSKILTAALGPDLVKIFQWSNFDTTLDKIIVEQPKDWLPKEFATYADLYLAAYQDARQVLTKSLGTDESKWVWGEMAKARFPHPLAIAPLVGLQFSIPPVPQNGTGGLLGSTVNVGNSVSMRLIADPAAWDKTQHGIALGESGIPASKHWNDQLPDWRAVTPREFPFTEAAVAAATKTTLVLEPK